MKLAIGSVVERDVSLRPEQTSATGGQFRRNIPASGQTQQFVFKALKIRDSPKPFRQPEHHHPSPSHIPHSFLSQSTCLFLQHSPTLPRHPTTCVTLWLDRSRELLSDSLQLLNKDFYHTAACKTLNTAPRANTY
jgi:hypothetical protein